MEKHSYSFHDELKIRKKHFHGSQPHPQLAVCSSIVLLCTENSLSACGSLRQKRWKINGWLRERNKLVITWVEGNIVNNISKDK